MATSQLDSFLSQIEGMELPYHIESQDAVRCDSCASVIHPNRTVSMWWTNRDALGNEQDLSLYRIQCEECTPSEMTWKGLEFSPKGWLEIVTQGRLTTDKRIEDVELLFYSPPSEGGEWTPTELLDAALPASGHARDMARDMDGPMDVIEMLIWGTIDPREIIGENGVNEQSEAKKMENLKLLAEEFERKGDTNRVLKYWERFGGSDESRVVHSGVDADEVQDE